MQAAKRALQLQVMMDELRAMGCPMGGLATQRRDEVRARLPHFYGCC
jgi:hypothetical protein